MPQGMHAPTPRLDRRTGTEEAVLHCSEGKSVFLRSAVNRFSMQSLHRLAFFAVLLGLAGCRKADDEGEAPPPVATVRPGVCDAGGGTASHDTELFPRKLDELCIDPHGETRAYGLSAPAGLDDVCVELFNGECEVYKRYGLERVTTLRYVDGQVVEGRTTNPTVALTLSRFSRSAGAYGFFTKRVLSDGDPREATVQPLDAGAAGALGGGIAYVWRGRHVLELTYVSEDESPDQVRSSSARVLPLLARQIGERLPGEKAPLPEVSLLPEENRIPLGARYEGERLLGVRGGGTGVIGHYQHGDHRWRVLVAIREDEQGAGDLLHSLSHGGQGWPTPFKQRRMVRARYAVGDDRPLRVWMLARRGRVVVGVGDDVFPESSAEGAPDLAEDKKVALLAELATAAERFSNQHPASEGGWVD